MPFERLRDEIRTACGGDAAWASAQVDYLELYLRGDARARTLIVEQPYIDRHYLEEYGAYYFSAFRNGGSTTTRIHVFRSAFVGFDVLPAIRALLTGADRERLEVDAFFAHGGDYLRQLLSLGLEPPARAEQLVTSVALPRYVGIVRFLIDGAALVDIVCDTTDIDREHPRLGLILAVFPFSGALVEAFARLFATVAPWIAVL